MNDLLPAATDIEVETAMLFAGSRPLLHFFADDVLRAAGTPAEKGVPIVRCTKAAKSAPSMVSPFARYLAWSRTPSGLILLRLPLLQPLA